MMDPTTIAALSKGIESAKKSSMGRAQVLMGILQNRKAKKINIETTDPIETSALYNLNARSRAIRTGTNYGRAIREINAGNKAASAAAFRSGYAMRSAIGVAEAQRNSALVNLINVADNAYAQNESIISPLRTRVTQRKLEVDLLAKTKLEASGSSLINTGMENMLGQEKSVSGEKGGVSKLLEMIGKKKEGNTPITPKEAPKNALPTSAPSIIPGGANVGSTFAKVFNINQPNQEESILSPFLKQNQSDDQTDATKNQGPLKMKTKLGPLEIGSVINQIIN